MRSLTGASIVILALTATGFAQLEPCKFGDPQVIGHADRVTLIRVNLIEPSGEVGTTVFVPDSETPLPGMIFSHSAIQGADARTDLRRFALALARAGLASIVLDGTIEWVRPNDDFKKHDTHTLVCAGQWMLLNQKMDRGRLGFAGPPNTWGGHPGLCYREAIWGKPCWLTHVILDYGETGAGESLKTDWMLTLKGQLEMARFVQHAFHLAEVKQEWLAEAPAEEPAQSGTTH